MQKEKTRHYALIITSSIIILGAGWKVYGHFAKTSVVESLAKTVSWVEERLAIGTHDARVERQRGAVDMARDRIRFETKTGSSTAAEMDNVRKEEERLDEVIKERDELVEQYKSKK